MSEFLENYPVIRVTCHAADSWTTTRSSLLQETWPVLFGISRLDNRSLLLQDILEMSCPFHSLLTREPLFLEPVMLLPRFVVELSDLIPSLTLSSKQLWDVRDGLCKQTFPGHESDINAVTVSILCLSPKRVTEPCLLVFPEWSSLRNRIWWCHMSIVWHSFRPGALHVLSW